MAASCFIGKHFKTHQPHELITLHYCRYPYYRVGIRRIRLLGRRVNSHFTGNCHYSDIVRHHQGPVGTLVFAKLIF